MGHILFIFCCKNKIRGLMSSLLRLTKTGRKCYFYHAQVHLTDIDALLIGKFKSNLGIIKIKICKYFYCPCSYYLYLVLHNYYLLYSQAMDGEKCVGAIVCKLDIHRKVIRRGYIAMLAVDENYRKMKIGRYHRF